MSRIGVRQVGTDEHKLWQTHTSRHKDYRTQVILNLPTLIFSLFFLCKLLPSHPVSPAPFSLALWLFVWLTSSTTRSAFEVELLSSNWWLQLLTHQGAGCCCWFPLQGLTWDASFMSGCKHFFQPNKMRASVRDLTVAVWMNRWWVEASKIIKDQLFLKLCGT